MGEEVSDEACDEGADRDCEEVCEDVSADDWAIELLAASELVEELELLNSVT